MKDEPDDVLDDRATKLVAWRRELLAALVQVRIDRGLDRSTIARRMASEESEVCEFEHYDANPTMVEIIRYAMAVGATIDSTVHGRTA